MTAQYQPGEYWGEVVDHGLTESKTKKTPQVFVRFLVLGKVSAANPDQYDATDTQYERTAYRAITENTVEYVVDDMKRLGFAGVIFDEFRADGPGSFDIRGQQFKFFCKHEMYEGAAREQWSIARERNTTPVADDALKRLQATFGKHLKPLAKAASPPQKPSQVDAANAALDKAAASPDEAPF